MAATDILPVIVNRSGGAAGKAGDDLEQQLRAAFAPTGRAIALELVAGDEVEATLAKYPQARRIAVGGGDGTLGGAAGHLAGTGRELAVLPLGTRNHFARQLGVPLDLEEAARVAANGAASPVDCATAGDRTFINNASLGAYVELVRERERSRLPKLPASIVAGWRVARRLRSRSYEVAIDGAPRRLRTPLLFVGNNRYEVAEGKPGRRDALDDGCLSILALAPLGRRALLRAVFRIALSKPDMKQDFALETTARSLRIGGRGSIGIALDGEELTLALPLEIAIRPVSLRVVMPSPERGADAGDAARS